MSDTSTQQPQTQNTVQPKDEPPKMSSAGAIVLIIVLVFLAIISIWAIIKSLLCTGKSGTTAEKVLGIAIAFFLGPFYFLYLYANKDYCMDEAPTAAAPMPQPIQMPFQQPVGGRRK